MDSPQKSGKEKTQEKTSILIVDDDPGITETMHDIFTEMEYDVTVARNGYAAIKVIKENTYDIAFIDIKMPEINGVETFQKIKKLNNPPKVILMTAYSVEDLIEKAKEEGVYAVVYKPLDIEILIHLIKKIELNLGVENRLKEFIS